MTTERKKYIKFNEYIIKFNERFMFNEFIMYIIRHQQITTKFKKNFFFRVETDVAHAKQKRHYK